MKTKSWLTKGYVYRSLFWGIFMFLFMGILLPLASKETIDWNILILRLGYWILFGFLGQLIIDYIDSKGKKVTTIK